jgi:DNA ligase-1
MRDFALLYFAIDETNKTTEKVAAMEQFFREAPPQDAAWAVNFLIGRRPKRLVISTKLQIWAAEAASIPDWLFFESYNAVGDLAETIAAILPDRDPGEDCLPQSEAAEESESFDYWVRERLLPLGAMTDDEQREALRQAWAELSRSERLVFNKLITGAWRVGVSQDLVVRAVSHASGVPSNVIAHRLMGDWTPSLEFYEWLIGPETDDSNISRPYPFCLAHPLEGQPDALGPIADWQVEWKFDGIRAQLIRRRGESFIWSRGEDLITDRFPEIKAVCDSLPDATVLDGEILAWKEGKPLPFLELQKRIGRKVLGKKILTDVPVVVVVFDAMEVNGQDWRERSTTERRAALADIVTKANREVPLQPNLVILPDDALAADPRLATRGTGTSRPLRSAKAVVSTTDPEGVQTSSRELERFSPGTRKRKANTAGPSSEKDRLEEVGEAPEHVPQIETSRLLLANTLAAPDWEDLTRQRQAARELNVEGVMIKRADAPYLVGRKTGYGWKWKIAPLTVDAVLIYAQRGSGKRASLYTDYTFGVWDDGKLVPFAKAYSGLTDEEIRRVDSWVRRNSTEKFGPVRVVKPELVMELAFEQIQLSNRHKAGIAVRFPRIQRWRHDKQADEADTLESVKALLKADAQ